MQSSRHDDGEPYPLVSDSAPSNTDADLPEFDDFLKQVGYGHLYRCLPAEIDEPLPACPPPAETIAMSTPSAGPAPFMTARRAVAATVGTAAVLATVVVMLWAPLQSALNSLKLQIGSTAYVTAPFFSLDRFESIRPGMTEEEVRDRVGPPLARRLRSGPGHEAWVYSAPKDLDQARFLLCVLTLEDGVVTAARATYAEPRGDLGYLWAAEPSQKVGDLTLVRGDGEQRTLNAKQAGPAILTSPGAELGALAEHIPGASVYPVNVSGNAGRVVNLGAVQDSVRNTYNAASVYFPSLSVYVKGRLLALPWHAPGVPLAEHYRDLAWLIAHA